MQPAPLTGTETWRWPGRRGGAEMMQPAPLTGTETAVRSGHGGRCCGRCNPLPSRGLRPPERERRRLPARCNPLPSRGLRRVSRLDKPVLDCGCNPLPSRGLRPFPSVKIGFFPAPAMQPAPLTGTETIEHFHFLLSQISDATRSPHGD